ncbi:MAG: LPS export ABC transporter periplasmic protein LptC [Alphaproteobacteria bacterium]
MNEAGREPGSPALEALSRRARWGSAPRESIDKAQRYTRFVRIMKRALPIAAAGIGAVLLVFALRPNEVSRFAMQIGEGAKLEFDLGMAKPRLTGTDQSGQPFTVTAESARQASDSNRAMLKKVEADITLKDGTWINLVSDAGVVDPDARTLDLAGNISLFSDSGYEAHTPTASVNLKTGIVRGDRQVQVQGPLGTLTADRFEFHRAKKTLYFRGNVKSVFYENVRGGK